MVGYFLLVLLVFGAVFWLQARPLMKNKQWREFVAFTALLWLDLAITIPLILGIRLPSWADLLFRLFEPVVKWMMQTPP